MIFKTIFAPLAFEETANLVTDTALSLAGTFKGHVMAHHVRQRFTEYPPMEFYPTSGAATVLAMEGHDEAAIVFARTMRAQFEERCDAGDVHIVPVSEALKQNGVTASWTEEIGQLPVNYSMAARVADLVVMAIPAAKEVYPERELFESLLMQSSAPVFLTPRSGLAAMPRRPLVAWDGSLQASRVVRCALPMLQESEETTLLTIGETDVGTPSLEAAKLWLERAGVRVKTRSVEWPDRPIAERILNQCDATNSDLVLMGGYSHSRLRENIMGGVTLHMIRHADRPLLMVH
ncbi:MAG: universal stress protein [Hyphomonas sp.]|uniref:universal stress protein n=2 Tax=Hyphomonas sp. TaxID=87 RepID=UPI003262DFC0